MNAAKLASRNLNARAAALCRDIVARRDELRVTVERTVCGTQVLDFGVSATGGLEAGRLLAAVCMAGLGDVTIVPNSNAWRGPAVVVRTDDPVAACMASQYAGWQIAGEKFFAMGSGPMRAAAAREEIFAAIGYREEAEEAVGVLEGSKLPPEAICREIAEKCGVSPDRLTLLVAPTRSLAGTVQIVARSVETALHKLHELGFPLAAILSGLGVAPLPPLAVSDVAAIGRTNDAILYGGEVTLWVQCEDAMIEQVGPQAPSLASPDYGSPFAQIFARYGGDFYKIDPRLFSPAHITIINAATGRSFRFGGRNTNILAESFGTEKLPCQPSGK